MLNPLRIFKLHYLRKKGFMQLQGKMALAKALLLLALQLSSFQLE